MSAILPTQQALHSCAIFDAAGEQLRVMSRHLADGLSSGQRTLGLVEQLSAAELSEALENEGVDVGRQVALGALRIGRARSTYVPNGRFDPAGLIGLIADTEREARRAGYRGLCAAGDMSWALAGDPGADRLVEYEYRLQQTIFGRLNVFGLCLYDGTRFDDGLLRQMARVHPVQVATVRRTSASRPG